MKVTVHKLNELLIIGENYINQASIDTLEQKPNLNKWSKKEILGHLIDSGINNLQRFTEIQFHNSPYKLRDYNQSNLVVSNFYQKANIHEILQFWISLNKRILFVIKNVSTDLYQNEILLTSDKKITFQFLMEDYVIHLEHHLNQIIS